MSAVSTQSFMSLAYPDFVYGLRDGQTNRGQNEWNFAR